jgi:sigma-E factor negative regulatory protein RseA
MSSERPEDRQGERDSQLSAMFDGELSAAECELLARRLTRDDALRAQWSRFAVIGAALRSERGVKLHDRVARRVQSQIAQEASYGDSSAVDAAPRSTAVAPAAADRSVANDRWMRFARPVFGAGIAAGVAAMSILWMRGNQESPEALVASNPIPESVTLAPEVVGTVAMNDLPAAIAPVRSNGEPDRYTTPAPSAQTSIAPPARLANYVVAHSEYSGPLSRRMALLGLVASDGAVEMTAPEQQPAQAARPARAPESQNNAH